MVVVVRAQLTPCMIVIWGEIRKNDLLFAISSSPEAEDSAHVSLVHYDSPAGPAQCGARSRAAVRPSTKRASVPDVTLRGSITSTMENFSGRSIARASAAASARRV